MQKISRTGPELPRVAIGFQPEFLDFQRGIRVGNLEDNQRITRILKLALEGRYQQSMVTERWGRGVFWQWIGFLSRANRSAMPVSSHVSFGCSKFFITVDTEEKLFKCGLQVERGYEKAPKDYPQCELKPDWDWHRLVRALKPKGHMERELRRLVMQEGFRVHAGGWDVRARSFSKSNFPDMRTLRKILNAAPAEEWAGFQVYFAMKEVEVRGFLGADLVDAMMAIFDEVAPLMNRCMAIPLATKPERFPSEL
ncbi:MAG TPA: hypothetical protein VMW38_18300 [Terriglobia bacterium]|nr:hypothetical protein [Terriglobia bacterium]